MKIILCSAKDSIRERWRSLLQGQQFSIYQVSSLPMLQTVVHKDEQYLLLVHQPFMDLQTIGTICRKSALYKVFVLSDTPNREEGFALLRREAVGYANTYISGPRLVEAVKVIQSGRVWFSQEVLSQFIQAVAANNQGVASEDSAKLLQSLTEREREIALLVARGLSNKAIGEQLYVSERTVKAHLSSIFAKTGAQSRLKLALLLNG
jgi:DNA-binding NarL/FixJ family response regulator